MWYSSVHAAGSELQAFNRPLMTNFVENISVNIWHHLWFKTWWSHLFRQWKLHSCKNGWSHMITESLLVSYTWNVVAGWETRRYTLLPVCGKHSKSIFCNASIVGSCWWSYDSSFSSKRGSSFTYGTLKLYEHWDLSGITTSETLYWWGADLLLLSQIKFHWPVFDLPPSFVIFPYFTTGTLADTELAALHLICVYHSLIPFAGLRFILPSFTPTTKSISFFSLIMFSKHCQNECP